MKEFSLNKIKAAGTTVGDVYFPQTKLLLPFNGSNGATNTTDESNSNLSMTLQGSSTISTAQSKFGGSSLYVPNSNPSAVYASAAGSTIQLTADFTIEWWVYRVQVSLTDNMLVGPLYGMASATSPTSSGGTLIGYYYGPTSTTQAELYSGSDGSSFNIANPVLLGAGSLGTVGQWVHMALTRSGATWNYYVNGTRTYTASLGSATLAAPGGYILLGKSWGTTTSMEAYYDDFRITQGQARYTGASFTVPATAHLSSAGDVNKQIIVNSAADGVAIGTGGINQARIAKAWCNIDGTGTISIRGSYNVSSLTDVGTGKYKVNFSTAMLDEGNYVAFCSGAEVNGGSTQNHLFHLKRESSSANILNEDYVFVASANAAATQTDDGLFCVIVFGN